MKNCFEWNTLHWIRGHKGGIRPHFMVTELVLFTVRQLVITAVSLDQVGFQPGGLYGLVDSVVALVVLLHHLGLGFFQTLVKIVGKKLPTSTGCLLEF